jgi:hypothetical protein
MFHVKPSVVFVLLVSAFACVTATAEVNKCVAPDGTSSFSDQPCPTNSKSKPSPDVVPTKTLPKMSAAEAQVAREAAGKEFMARYNESMTPECRKFANAMPDRQASNLSKAEQAGRDGFKESNCDQMVLTAQTWYADRLKKIDAAIDRPTARTPACKKLAETMSAIYLNGPRTDDEVKQYIEASESFKTQKCDQKHYGEAMEAAMEPYKAIADKVNACDAKYKNLIKLRPQRTGMTEAGKKDMAVLEKELSRECPEFK